jgi:pSer/pThr/pTyr-binding forkhead associated (FHA) protein
MDKDLDLGSFGIAARIEDAPDLDPSAAPSGSTVVFQAPIVTPPAPTPAVGGNFILKSPSGPFPLQLERVSVGRGKSNDLVLTDSSVSREHAELIRSAAGYLVRDLGSTNGVLVNGSRVREQPLKAGDRILFGSCEVRYERVDDGILDT